MLSAAASRAFRVTQCATTLHSTQGWAKRRDSGFVLCIHRWGRWSYGPSMPLLLGVGVSPLAQWVVVPVVMLWLAKRYLRRGAVEPVAAP